MKTMYLSNFQKKILTLSMRTTQSTNKMAADDGQLQLIIHDVQTIFFNVNTGNAIKTFDGGLKVKVMRAVHEKHMIYNKFFGLTNLILRYHTRHFLSDTILF